MTKYRNSMGSMQREAAFSGLPLSIKVNGSAQFLFGVVHSLWFTTNHHP